jgi:hypothetical protein
MEKENAKSVIYPYLVGIYNFKDSYSDIFLFRVSSFFIVAILVLWELLHSI